LDITSLTGTFFYDIIMQTKKISNQVHFPEIKKSWSTLEKEVLSFLADLKNKINRENNNFHSLAWLLDNHTSFRGHPQPRQ
jgi:hypothetical protein